MTKTKAPRRGIPIIVYPPGVKDLTQDLSKDELIRRLKMLARSFQDMEQEEDIAAYEPLALYLVEPFFIKHTSKDVRLLVACCIADIFRIFAPEAPFTTVEQLKMIFQYINKQLWGLENVEGPSWKRYFYLLENLAMVKSYNICMELDDASEIFVELFTIFFSIINEHHTPKVRTFMLDVICPLISENDAVPSELLEIILSNLLDSKKLENPLAFQMARDLVKRTAMTIEPSIQAFFNNTLILGRTSDSDMSSHSYELIYQLNTISSSLLLSVLPQLEFKLKSNDEKERLQVTRLLGKMFSDKDSDLISQNKPLWNCFLGRFSDICTDIRVRCVKFVSTFLLYHSYVSSDLTERLRERAHDTDEGVRQEVVSAVVTAAKRDISKITNDMLTVIKERTLDKKWKIRKEAVLGLAHIYKKWYHNPETTRSDYERLKWVKNKLLHMYYQTNIEDRLLVERIYTMTLVPYTMDVQERMGRLFQLFATVDQHAVKAIMELMKCQHMVRSHVRELMALYHKDRAKDKERLLLSKLATISKYLPEPSKAQEHLKKLSEVLNEDLRIRGYMNHVVDPAVTCKKAIQAVAEVMKKFGNPKNPSPIYETIKTLMERISPLMIDSSAVKELIGMVADQVEGKGEDYDEDQDESPTVRGLKLLQSLSAVFPSAYKTTEARELLMTLLKNDDENVSDIALQIFIATGQGLEEDQPQIASSLLPMLMSKARTGTRPQAKSAVHCIGVVAANRHTVYKMIFESSQKCLTLEHENFATSMTSLGYIARLAPQHFAAPMKSVIATSIVKGLLMKDVSDRSHIKGIWCHDDVVSEETNAKIVAIKTIIHWLQGLRSNQHGSATSTLRLLTTYLKNEGDLMEKDKASKAEMSRLRLAAGCALLKLAQIPCYAELISTEQFQLLALLINDECYQVREHFAKKLNKGLISLRLPLSYLSIFSMCAKDPVRESRTAAKQYIQRNINTRREYLKTRTVGSSQLLSLLPENVVPYAIHLLAHDPDFSTLRDIEALNDIKECLWFLLEPLVNRNENCSFIRKLVETIKRTKDAQTPDDKSAHKRMYAVCDIVLGLLFTRTPTYTLKEHPGDVLLPIKLFVKPKKAINSHMDSFLPKKLQEEFSKVPGEEKKNLTDKLLETPPPKGKGAKQAAAAASNNNKKQDKTTDKGDKTKATSSTADKSAAPTTSKGAKKNAKVVKKSDENTPKKSTRRTAASETSVEAAETSSSAATSPVKNDKRVPARNRRGALAEKKITNNEQDTSSQSTSTSSTPRSPAAKRKLSQSQSSSSSQGSEVVEEKASPRKRNLKTSKKQSSSQSSSQTSQDSPKKMVGKRKLKATNKKQSSQSSEGSDDTQEEVPAKRRRVANRKYIDDSQTSDSQSSQGRSQSSASPVASRGRKGSNSTNSKQSITRYLTQRKGAKALESSSSSPSSTQSSPAKRPHKRQASDASPTKQAKKPKTKVAAETKSVNDSRKGKQSALTSKAGPSNRASSDSSQSSSGSPVKKLLNGPSIPTKRLGTRSGTKTTRSGRTRMDSPLTSSSPASSPVVPPSPKKMPSKSLNRTQSSRKDNVLSKRPAASPRKTAPSPKKTVRPSPKKLTSSPRKAVEPPRKFASKKQRGSPAKSPKVASPRNVVSPNRTFVQKKLTSFTAHGARGAGDAKKMTSTPKVSSSPLRNPLLTGKKAPSPVKKAPMRATTKRNLALSPISQTSSSSAASSPSSINSSPRKGLKSASINSPVKKKVQPVLAKKNVRNVRRATSRRQVNGIGNSDGESSQNTTSDDDSQASARSARNTRRGKDSPKKKMATATTRMTASRNTRKR